MVVRNTLDKRLFLALWPDAQLRQQLAQCATLALGQRQQIAAANLHLTLVFLGATTAQRLQAYRAALADLHVPPAQLILDRYGYWRRARILWLGATHTPPALDALVTALQQRLCSCGFVPEARAFQAHVTLARRFTGQMPHFAPPAVHWPLREVTLLESKPSSAGVKYEVLERWPQLGTTAHVSP